MVASLTRSAGTAALVAASVWLIGLVGFLVMGAGVLSSWQTTYTLLTAGGLVAGLATLVALNGLLSRAADGAAGWRWAALGLGALGVVVIGLVLWAYPLWTALLSAASVIVVYRLRGVALVPKLGPWAFVAAWPLSFGLFVLLDAIKLGQVDEYGDYPMAGGIGIAVWCGLLALGLAVYGRWLRQQEAAEGPHAPPALI